MRATAEARQHQSCRSAVPAHGRDCQFAVNTDSSHSIRPGSGGRTLLPRTHIADAFRTAASWIPLTQSRLSLRRTGAKGQPIIRS